MAEKAVFGVVHAGTVIAGVGIFGKVVSGDVVANNAVIGNAYIQNLNVDAVQTIDYTVQSTAVTIAASPAPTQTLVYLTTWPTPAPVVGDALYQGAYSDVVNGVRGVRLITAVNSTNKTLAFTQAGALWAAGPANVVKAKDTANETATRGARMRIGQTTSGDLIPAIVTSPAGVRIGTKTLSEHWVGQVNMGAAAFTISGGVVTPSRLLGIISGAGFVLGSSGTYELRFQFSGAAKDPTKYVVMLSDSTVSGASLYKFVWNTAGTTYFDIAFRVSTVFGIWTWADARTVTVNGAVMVMDWTTGSFLQ
jgi:hypothetical protein